MRKIMLFLAAITMLGVFGTEEGSPILWELRPGASGCYTLVVTGEGDSEIPDDFAASVPEIAQEFGNNMIDRLEIGTGIKTIGSSAFANLTSLEAVDFTEGNTLETIGGGAFAKCTNLTSISLEKCLNLKRIEDNTVPNNGMSGAFSCTKIQSLQLPEDMEYIGVYAFYDCNHFTELNLSGTAKIGGSAFGSCDSLEKVSLTNVQTIGGSAFSGNGKLKEVVLNNVGEVGDSAFLNLSSLETLTLQEVNTLRTRAFKNCPVLTELIITGITSIGSEVFQNSMKNLKSFEYTQEIFPGLQSVGSNVFSNTGIETLVIGKDMPIENSLFSNSNSMNKVIFMSGWSKVKQNIFDGTTAKFEAVISAEADEFYGENLKTISNYASQLYFKGPNYLTITAVDGGNGFPEPLNSLSGYYYVDEMGALYHLNEDGTAAFAYCPAGLSQYKVMEFVPYKDGNGSYKVTSMEEHAFALSKDMEELPGEEEDVPSSDDEDDQYKLPEDGAATREVISYSMTTGESDIKNVFQISTSASASHRTQEADGDSFDYYTGEMNDTIITVSPGEALDIQEKVLRIYLTSSAPGLKFNIPTGEDGESYYIDGNKFIRKNLGNGTYYIDLPVLTSDTTIGFPMNVTYPSPDTGGGAVYIWGAILDKEKAAEEAAALQSGEKIIILGSESYYHKLTWATRPDEFQVEKSSTANAKIKASNGLSVVTGLNFDISAVRTNENTQMQNLGEDYVTAFDYVDTFTLPDGISWKSGLAESIKAGNWKVDGNRILVTSSDAEETVYQLADYVLSGDRAGKLSMVEFGVRVNEEDQIEFYWKVKNENTTDDGRAAESEIPTVRLNVADEALIADFHILENEETVEIGNHVTMTPHYTYQENSLTTEAYAEAQLELSAGDITLTKTHDRSDNMYWGEDIHYTVTISNESVLEASGFSVLEDHLNTYQYISGKNLQKMFTDDTAQKLSIQILNATLYRLPTQKADVVAVDGNFSVSFSAKDTGAGVEAYYNGRYEQLDESNMRSKGTAVITFHWAEQDLVMSVTDSSETSLNKDYVIGENGAFLSVEEALCAIGYVPLDYGQNSYHIFWDMTDITLEPGESVKFQIPATVKDTFMLLSMDCIGKNDVISSSLRLCQNEAILKDTEGRKITSHTVAKQANREMEINKTAGCAGETLNEDFNIKDGAVIDYLVTFKHLGKGSYDTLPLADHMSGANVLLAKVVDNPEAADTWGAGLPVEKINGERCYVLCKEGTYERVKLGDYWASEVIVRKSSTGLDTLIHWYFINTPKRAYTTNVTYQVLVSRAYAEISGAAFEVNNETWLNDHQSHRLYASLNGDGSIISGDKYIVTAAGERLQHLELEKGMSEVNYELLLKNEGDTEASIDGPNIYDALPQTFGCFVWGETGHQVQISYSENAEIINPDSWMIEAKAPVSEAITQGQYYICWDSNFEAVIPAGETLRILVKLELPAEEVWDQYASACNGQLLYNNFYIYHMSAQVSHGLKGISSAKLQKGVYDIATMSYHPKALTHRQKPYQSTGTRHLYGNLSSRAYIVTYYVSLYNDGTNRIYLNPFMDDLPKGFRLLSLAMTSKIEERNGSLGRYSALQTSPGGTMSSRTENFASAERLPLSFVGADDVTYLSTDVTATVVVGTDGAYDLRFTFSGGDLEDGRHYDPEKGSYYLLPGEAIRFGYCVDTNETSYTEEIATNTIMMPFTDYINGGLNISGTTIEAGKENKLNPNDGTCKIITDVQAAAYGFVREDFDQNNQWLSSDVSVSRGKILPGIRKTAVSPNAKIDASVEWEVTAYNNGNYPLIDYVITDEMGAPYKFIGEVFWEIYPATDGITGALSNPIAIGGAAKEQPLFTILSNDLDKGGVITLKDNGGTLILLSEENGYTATISSFYTYWYDGTYVTESGVYRPAIKVSFSENESKNQILSISFASKFWGIPEDGFANLRLHTTNESGLYYNKVFNNQAWITPTGLKKEFDPNPIHGNFTIFELDQNKYPSVLSDAMVNVSSGFFTTAEKRVTEVNGTDFSNTAASTGERNYILLKDKESIFRYGLEVTTPEEQSINRFVLIDNLPQEGDYTSFGTAVERHSKFKVSLAKEPEIEVKIQSASEEAYILNPDQYEIGYSLKTVTKQQDAVTMFSAEDWNGTSAWETDLTKFLDEEKQIVTARSLRLVIDDISLLPKDSVITMSFNAIINDDDASAGEIAWNSFGYHYEIEQGSGNVLGLEAAPLPVGIKFPSVPELKKELVDLEGEICEAKNDDTFSFLIYKGAAVSDLENAILDNLENSLEREGIDQYFIQNIQIAAGKNCSDTLKLTPDSWQWEEDAQYTILELPANDPDYEFVSINRMTGKSYTFIYHAANTECITVVNKDISQKSKFILPESGGAGSERMIVCGATLVLAAIAILILKRHFLEKTEERT